MSTLQLITNQFSFTTAKITKEMFSVRQSKCCSISFVNARFCVWFSCFFSDPFEFGSEPINVRMGSVITPHHTMTLKVKTLADTFNEPERRTESSEDSDMSQEGISIPTTKRHSIPSIFLIRSHFRADKEIWANRLRKDEFWSWYHSYWQIWRARSSRFISFAFIAWSDFQSQAQNTHTLENFKKYLFSHRKCPTIKEMKNLFPANLISGM